MTDVTPSFDALPVEEKVVRLRKTIELLATWLVQAQTGFSDHDLEALGNFLLYGTVTKPADSPITRERPRDFGEPGAAT